MEFDKKDNSKKFGKTVGYLAMYLIFTIILYFILKFLNKLPPKFNFSYIVVITLSIVLIGSFVKYSLKK